MQTITTFTVRCPTHSFALLVLFVLTLKLPIRRRPSRRIEEELFATVVHLVGVSDDFFLPFSAHPR